MVKAIFKLLFSFLRHAIAPSLHQLVFVFFWHVSSPVFNKLNVQAVALGSRRLRAYWFGSGATLFGFTVQVQASHYVPARGKSLPVSNVTYFSPGGSSTVLVNGTRNSRAYSATLPPF